MHWETLSEIDWVVIGIVIIALVGLVPLYRNLERREARRREAAHRAYFYQGGLIRALMSRWGRGTPRLTDQRQPTDEQP